MLGGTEQKAETMTIPSSVLNIDTNGYSNLVTANLSSFETSITGIQNWGVGTTSSRSSDYSYDGTYSLKCITGGGAGQGCGITESTTYLVPVVVGVTYNISAYVKAPQGKHILISSSRYNSGGGHVAYAGSSGYQVATGEWQRISFSYTAVTGDSYINVQTAIQEAEVVTYYTDCLQVSATATAKPWILGGTQVNTGSGTIEDEIYVNTAFITGVGKAFEIGTSATANRLTTYYSATNKITGLTSNNVNTATTTASSNTFSPGSWVKVALSWINGGESVSLSGTITNSSGGVLPVSAGTALYLLSNYNGTAGRGNTLMRNFVVTKNRRSDAEVVNRYNKSSPTIDRKVTATLPLKSNLNMYKTTVVG